MTTPRGRCSGRRISHPRRAAPTRDSARRTPRLTRVRVGVITHIMDIRSQFGKVPYVHTRITIVNVLVVSFSILTNATIRPNDGPEPFTKDGRALAFGFSTALLPSTPPHPIAPQPSPYRYTHSHTLPSQASHCHACHTACIAHPPGANPTWAARKWAPRARVCRAPPPAARRSAGRRSGTSCAARRRRAGSRCRRGRGRTRSAPRAAPPRR